MRRSSTVDGIEKKINMLLRKREEQKKGSAICPFSRNSFMSVEWRKKKIAKGRLREIVSVERKKSCIKGAFATGEENQQSTGGKKNKGTESKIRLNALSGSFCPQHRVSVDKSFLLEKKK